jgi:2,5-diketo-D-gluconate reductase A
MSVPTVTADNGVEIPQLGLGVWQIEDGVVPDVVSAAFEAGYRHIDTAALYRNESGVGRAIAASALPREELFVTTKVWNNDQGYDATLRACDASLSRLGLEYVDLYLIHWPAPRQDRYVDTWRALEKLYADGRARSIGVSNFRVAHLRRLFDETDLRPVVNQIELHPALPQDELRAFHAENDILTEAWSPLAQGALLEDDRIAKLAAKHGRTPAQIVLRWHLQLGNIVIPKTRTISRLAENIDVFGFELDNDDMAVIADLDTFTRTGPDPDRLG